MSKSRSYCFTVNNYDEAAETTLKAIRCRYLVYGREVGESGTPHLQGYILFPNPRAFNAMKKLLPAGAHIEKTKGTSYEAAEYCKKDGDFYEEGVAPVTPKEFGERGGQAQKRRYEDALAACKEGRFEDIPADLYTRHERTYERIHAKEMFKKRNLEDTTEQHLWFWGKSRTGKSRAAREQFPGAYMKQCNKWWDGYVGEDFVIIEEVIQKHDFINYFLKIWADRYPFRAEVKGNSFMIRPKTIIVTSNWHPSEIWSEEQELEPLLQRFKCVEFKKLSANGKDIVDQQVLVEVLPRTLCSVCRDPDCVETDH